jgi:hypothetical protein
MGELTQKLKETLKSAKDTVVGTGVKPDYNDTPSGPLREYDSREPTSATKIDVNEMKREAEMTKRQRSKEEITEQEQAGANLEESLREAASKAKQRVKQKVVRPAVNMSREAHPDVPRRILAA